MAVSITWDVPESQQESGFMNATLQDFGPEHAISIAVYIQPPPELDVSNRQEIVLWLDRVCASVRNEGGEVEVQIGPKDG